MTRPFAVCWFALLALLLIAAHVFLWWLCPPLVGAIAVACLVTRLIYLGMGLTDEAVDAVSRPALKRKGRA